jgi:hypothetical protein
MFHSAGRPHASLEGLRMSNAKIISIVDAELRELEARISVRSDEAIQFIADELSRLRDRVAKLEEGVTPETSA